MCAGIALALNDPKRLRLIPYTRERNPLRGGFSAAVPLIERFKAHGHPVYTTCKDVRVEN